MKTFNFLNFNSRQLITVIILASGLILTAMSAAAQSVSFLPKGVSSFTASSEVISFNSYFNNGSQNGGLLENILIRRSIASTDLTGEFAYSSKSIAINGQYGLYSDINIGFSLPYYSISRSNNLTLNNNTYLNIYNSLKNDSYSGLGGASIWGSWRAIYTDRTDFRLGANLLFNSADVNLVPDQMDSIISGLSELSFDLNWLIYSFKSELFGQINLNTTFPLAKTVRDLNGNSVKYYRDLDITIIGRLTKNQDRISFGGEYRYEIIGDVAIDESRQNVGYLRSSLGVFASYGNLPYLETQKEFQPWEVLIGLDFAIFGNRAPATSLLSLAYVMYF